MVTLSDYQFNAGSGLNNQVLFGGNTSAQDLDALNKALSAESTTGRDTTNLTNQSGAPLKVESLDKTLKNITYGDKQVVFWKNIPKSAAYNTVEEYNQLTSYGQDAGGFNDEGALPQTEDSQYVRRAQLVKFLGVVKEVTHPMTLVNTMVGDIVKREIENGTLWILRKLDRALFNADSSMVPQEFNGLYTQHQSNDVFGSLNSYMASDNVVDLRGATLSEGFIENGANAIIQNFGIGTDLYAPPRVLSDFVKNFYGNKFIPVNGSGITNGVMGQKVEKFMSQFGEINLNWDIFMNPPVNKAYNAGATSNLAPGAPTADPTTPIAAVGATVANSKWASTDAGSYFYAVVAINNYGESAVTVLGSATTAIVTNGAVDLKFTPTSGANSATAFQVYRSQKGAASAALSTFYPLFKVNLSQVSAGYDGGAAGVVRDLNRWMPNTYQAMLVQNDNQVIEFKQLAPLMKMDLALLSPSYRFMLLHYGTPFLYAGLKMTRFINIGIS